jgi:hypothetical protein
MRKTLRQQILLYSVAIAAALFSISLLQTSAIAADTAKVEAILGAASCNDYNWEMSSDGSYWSALNVSYVAYPVNTAYQTLSIFVPAAE